MRVRRAEPADTAVLAGLIRELADYERLTETLQLTEERLRAHLFGDRPYAEALIGEVDGEPACYALYFHTYSTFLGRPGVYLEDLFVRPERRGSGLGKALLARVAQVCLERGGAEARLEWAVLDWNRPAIGFYESLGARPNSEWTVYRLTGDALERLGRGND